MGLFKRNKKEKVKTESNSQVNRKTEKEKDGKQKKQETKVENKTPIKKNNEEQKKTTSKAKQKKPIYRVVYDKEARLWLIKKDGAKRTIASFVTKDEAMNRVKDLSEVNSLNFVVHKKDGKFQKK